jgi:hypothetical protein
MFAGAIIACGYVMGPLPEEDGSAASSGGPAAGDTDAALPSASTEGTGADQDVPTGSTTGSMDSGGDHATTGASRGDCCSPQPFGGCDDGPVATCVCDVDPSCCEQAWSEVCVEQVERLGCGECMTGETTDDAEECCEISSAPGCLQPEVEGCVCALDSFCCTEQWDLLCVELVEKAGCGSCPGSKNDPVDSCCEAHLGEGCDEPSVSDCVCAQEPSCCNGDWDESCAQGVEAYGCGICNSGTSGTPGGDCCTANDAPGCADSLVAECVCDSDPFCCYVKWDELCTDAVEALDCGGCSGGTGGTAGGDGMSTGGPGDPDMPG